MRGSKIEEGFAEGPRVQFELGIVFGRVGIFFCPHANFEGPSSFGARFMFFYANSLIHVCLSANSLLFSLLVSSFFLLLLQIL